MNENINDFVEKYEDFNKTIMKQDEGRKFPIFNKRFREYNPDQILFYTFNAGETFPEGSFERFAVIGLKKVRTRWTIICLVYNLKRIYNLGVKSN